MWTQRSAVRLGGGSLLPPGASMLPAKRQGFGCQKGTDILQTQAGTFFSS